VIIAFVLFLVIKVVNRMMEMAKPKCEPAPCPVIKDCPFCFSKIPVKATRCPQCTSQFP
jgi:large conductance mechanosensitive channel